MTLSQLYQDKLKLVESYLAETQRAVEALKSKILPLSEEDVDPLLDLLDQLSDEREARVRVLSQVDQQIREVEKNLHGGSPIPNPVAQEMARLAGEIHLTDQSLFLYIQSMGSQLRSLILRRLKEKEAVSKFKSQSHHPTGEGLDQTV